LTHVRVTGAEATTSGRTVRTTGVVVVCSASRYYYVSVRRAAAAAGEYDWSRNTGGGRKLRLWRTASTPDTGAPPPTQPHTHKMHRYALLLIAFVLPLAGCEAKPPTGSEWASLAIQVRTTGGTPVRGVRVQIAAEGDSTPDSLVTGSRGSLTEVGIAPGVYFVDVRQPPTGYQVPSTQPNPVRAVVVQGRETTVRFTLEPT